MIMLQLRHFLLVLIALIVIPQSVSAYLDPGVGSMIWQLLVAVGLGVAFTLKMYWQKLKDRFRPKSADHED
ncbi:hypothetical protein DIC75_02630 [Methanoculleus sp. CWC-02]|uniref:Holin n=1 Tax=Methanoculleus oceani TaxID=2184756 RepID=A0ABD4TDY8_9EURY|nr:hypothetical protein [Methanoculleus sp. CWC-02]